MNHLPTRAFSEPVRKLSGIGLKPALYALTGHVTEYA